MMYHGSSAFRLPANTSMVDRGLNVAYERIRDIHNNLADIEYVKENLTDIKTLYEYFKEGLGDYDGIYNTRFLGEVGVDNPELKTVPPLVQLAHAVSDMKILSSKVDDIYRVSSKIKHVIEVSYKLLQIETVADNMQAVLNIHQHIVELLKISDSIVNLIAISEDLDTLNEIALHLNTIDALASHLDNIDTVSDYIDQVDLLAKEISKINRVHQSIANIDRLSQSADHIDTLGLMANKLDHIEHHLLGLEAIYNNMEQLSLLSAKLEPVVGLSKLPDGDFALEKGVQYVVLDELESDEEKFSYWGSIKNIVLDTYPGTKILPNNTTTIFMDGTESEVFPEDYTPVRPADSIHVNDPDFTDPNWSFNVIPDEDDTTFSDASGNIIVGDDTTDSNNGDIIVIPDIDDGETTPATNPSDNTGGDVEIGDNTGDDNNQGSTSTNPIDGDEDVDDDI